jgi:hypothetical protein
MEVGILGKILGHFSPIVPPSADGCSRVVTCGDAWWRKLEHLNPDLTISLRLQCVVENNNKYMNEHSVFVDEVLRDMSHITTK